MNTINFCIENGINTSYIDSLIMALFYKQSTIDNILNDAPTKCEFYYLQELIRTLVDSVRRHYSIGIELINEIRNYSIMCGWKQNENVLDLFNIADYYEFIVNNIGNGVMKYEIINKNSEICEKHIVTIKIPISKDDDDDITSRELLCKWINNNLLNEQDKTSYHFDEIPCFVALYLNRFDANKVFYRGKIDIMKQIRFDTNNDINQNKIVWNIHSIICYSESNPHYYSLVNADSKWYIFDSFNIPSLDEINIKQTFMTDKIKQECVMIFYKLDEFNY